MGNLIYVPAAEHYFLVSMGLMGEVMLGQQTARAQRYNEDLLGLQSSHYGTNSDEYRAKLLRESVMPMAFEDLYPEVGEEDVQGHVRQADDGPTDYEEVDISPCGPASLLGKVALELARRMEAELSWDRRAAERSWAPPGEPP